MPRPVRFHLRSGASAAAILLAGVGFAVAGPEGGVVNGGAATIGQQGTTTTIQQQTQKVSIDWQSFDIGADEAVRFDQPNASAIALNRIQNRKPTTIQGELTANGNVWLINPRGVLFGAGSAVDVGGLLATTAPISDDDFFADRGRFAGGGEGTVGNAGDIRAGAGGVILAAPEVENAGRITVIGGDAQLHAGSVFTIDMAGDGLLSFGMDSEGAEARRLVQEGAIVAEGGSVYLSAAATDAVLDSVISAGGTVEATGLAEVGGRIVLTGGGLADIGGSLSADAVTVDAARIAVRDGAAVRADGAAGGGSIDIGLRNGRVATDSAVVEQGATLSASATVDGAGGTVDVWSERATAFFGTLAVEGAGLGAGGFADISSAGRLAYDGTARLGGPGGRGQLTFDPATIVISNPDPGCDPADGCTPITFSDAEVLDGVINAGDGGTDATFFITPDAIGQALESGEVILVATESIMIEDGFVLSGDITLVAPKVDGVALIDNLDGGGTVTVLDALPEDPVNEEAPISLAAGGIDDLFNDESENEPPEFIPTIPEVFPGPEDLSSTPLSPDREQIGGFFSTIGLIEPVLEEEEPITNRGNDEEWFR